MILCWCCERRFCTPPSDPADMCACADSYCPVCILCLAHCACAGGAAEGDPFIVVRRTETDNGPPDR